MNKQKSYVTHIIQQEVKVLSPKDYDGYEQNQPSSKWEFIEYAGKKDKDGKPIRAWIPQYSLDSDKIKDFSKVKIVER
jgi:hypothetical protein